ncbi:MAG TPA: hypothetical protein VNP93_11095 [Gaiellaceae bacterium]|nr:hypothetical protein [Gaiellaceae bacterium]
MSAESFISERYRGLAGDGEELAAIRGQLDTEGIVELTDFLTPEAHALLKQQILHLESEATSSSAGSNQKYALKGDHLKETMIGELASSSYILGVVNGILEPWVADDPIRADEIVPGINIMRGPGDVTAYHFDGTYLNMILPVVVPKITGERRGQLTAYPNIRSFKKTFWDTKVVAALARVKALHRLFRKREVDYQERGAYLFYGYRTLHGVESPAEAGLRAVTNLTVGPKRFL